MLTLICRYTGTVRFLVSYALCMVSLLTSIAINLDTLFPLSLRIRYIQFVTLKRTYVLSLCIDSITALNLGRCATNLCSNIRFLLRKNHFCVAL